MLVYLTRRKAHEYPRLPELGINIVDKSRTSLSREHKKKACRMPLSSWSQKRISRDYHEVIWMEYAGTLSQNQRIIGRSDQ
jgi:hypothetical protein